MNAKINLPLLTRGIPIFFVLLLLAGIVPRTWAAGHAAQNNAAAPGDPVIHEQPTGRIASSGGHVALSVLVAGTTLNFQWLKDGQPLANDTNIFGATTSVLNIDPAGTNNSGAYSVIITNATGAATSIVASVTVNPVALQLSVIFGPSPGLLLRIDGPIGDVYRIDGSANPNGPFSPYLYLTNRSGSVQTFRPFSQSPPSFMQARLDHMLPVLYSSNSISAPGLRAYGKLNQIWKFQGTTNFVHWDDLATVTNTNGWAKFTDPTLPLPSRRFYRITPP